jgi:hypothetical protein
MLGLHLLLGPLRTAKANLLLSVFIAVSPCPVMRKSMKRTGNLILGEENFV